MDSIAGDLEVIEEPTMDPPPPPPGPVPDIAGRYVEITEQPAPRSVTFRYAAEGRSWRCISGVRTNQERKTYPTIKIHGYVGPATILTLCITTEGLFVHPHSLIGKNCAFGVHNIRVKITDDTREYQLKDLMIQRTKRRDIHSELARREQMRVDPFHKGFEHANDVSRIDLNAVRLAIQVIVKDAEGRDHSLFPIYTDIISDKRVAGPARA